MTASGPEDIGASWVDRQFLKSAHWTRESPLSAIKVLRETVQFLMFTLEIIQSASLIGDLHFNHIVIVDLMNTIFNNIKLITSFISSSYLSIICTLLS